MADHRSAPVDASNLFTEQVRDASAENVRKTTEQVAYSSINSSTYTTEQVQVNKFVLGENGTPLVVYHGTNRVFPEFDPDAKSAAIPLIGMFFTPYPDIAERFASNGNEIRDDEGFIAGYEGGNIRPVYLFMNNPAQLQYSDDETGGLTNEKVVKEDIQAAMAAGHDGVVIRGWADGSGPVQYVVFKPNQIKSVFAL